MQELKDARDYETNLRVTVRSVGVRHERNLFIHGVQEQLTYIIDYLQTGTIPKWMKDHFE